MDEAILLRKSSDTLAAFLERSSRALALTGAGLSTECGVPDFRSPGSPWRTHRPIPFEEFMASEEARAEAWRRKFAIDDLWAGARPGRGHRALAALARNGELAAIITQNIDGLQQAADLPHEQLIELHGNGTYAVCLTCEARHELMLLRDEFERSGRAPLCACGGVVKAATISFGQAMPRFALRRALEETLACDLFLAIGSSLVVRPAAELPCLAKRNGARLVIVNRDPTALDGIADFVARGDIATILEPLTHRQDS